MSKNIWFPSDKKEGIEYDTFIELLLEHPEYKKKSKLITINLDKNECIKFTLVNNEPIICKYYDDTQSLKSIIQYTNFKRNGVYYSFFEDGQVKQVGFYKEGTPIDKWVSYDKFGNRKEVEYVNGYPREF